MNRNNSSVRGSSPFESMSLVAGESGKILMSCGAELKFELMGDALIFTTCRQFLERFAVVVRGKQVKAKSEGMGNAANKQPAPKSIEEKLDDLEKRLTQALNVVLLDRREPPQRG